MTWGVSGLEVRFGRLAALRAVTLEAAAGAVTGVVGGDGAGKTTLLRVLAGALGPSQGEVRRPDAPRIGYLPASSGVYPDLSVDENLRFRAITYRLDPDLADSRAEQLLAWTGLAPFRDRLTGHLSGGMRQKLGVVASMLHQPELLVLDEPTTGVDPVSRTDLWRLIGRAAAEGTAVVFATTYLDEAERASHLLVLDSGAPLTSGTPDHLVDTLPGSLWELPAAPTPDDAPRAWSRRARWRLWVPSDGAPPEAATAVEPDLQDAVTVLALQHELRLQAEPSQRELSGRGDPERDGARGDAPNGGSEYGAPGQLAAPLALAEGAVQRFGDFVAVRGVDLTVRPGEVVGLLGANGAGKTTLIRMLLGLLRPSGGTVRLFGQVPSRQTRRRLGYVPQGLGLYDDLTAAENLAFTETVFRAGRRHQDRDPGLSEMAAAAAGADGVVVGQLPLGAQRRVAFAAALRHHPDLLVLDEPTSGVDPLARARLWEMIRTSATAGVGVLVTTHHMEETEECDRLVVMAAGEVVAEGTVAEIVGDSRVCVVETDAWAEPFDALEDAGLPVALSGRSLRVPGATPAGVRDVLRPLGDNFPYSVSEAQATLEERFFELAADDGQARSGVPSGQGDQR